MSLRTVDLLPETTTEGGGWMTGAQCKSRMQKWVPQGRGRQVGAQIALRQVMPAKKPIEKAKQALRKGKSPSTAAGEFIREEMERIGDGKHGAGSPKQAIAIGLAKARRAGIPLRPQPESPADERSRRSVERAYEAGREKKPPAPAPRRARTLQTPKRKPKSVVSKSAVARGVKAGSRRKRVAARPGR